MEAVKWAYAQPYGWKIKIKHNFPITLFFFTFPGSFFPTLATAPHNLKQKHQGF